MNRFSPLRYPGGKGKLASYLKDVMVYNDLVNVHYAEPYAGGAAVALELLFCEKVQHIHINDYDPCVYAFWHSIVQNTEAFIDRIEAVNVSIDAWFQAREIKRQRDTGNLLDLGFAAFFLNRTNRSGILNGGVIGGLKQNGQWKIDCRFNKEDLIQRIKRIGIFRSRISVSNHDASIFLTKYVKTLPGGSMLYIDPPYYEKGACLYENHYTHEDHLNISRIIAEIKNLNWIVSYDDSEYICEFYKEYRQEKFGVNYSARKFNRGNEVMIFSDKILSPSLVYCSDKEKKILENI